MNWLHNFDAWLSQPAWCGQPRAVFIIPAMILTIFCLAIIIRNL